MTLQIQTFTATSGITAHPSVQVSVPAGWKVLGGGAFDHWTGAGSLLTASFPLNDSTWFVAGKDHEISRRPRSRPTPLRSMIPKMSGT